MNTFAPLEKLDEFKLHEYYEVWMTTTEQWPQDPETVNRKCIWRKDREVTRDAGVDQDIYQESLHNLPRLWIVCDYLSKPEAVAKVEKAVESTFAHQHVAGQMNPPEEVKVPSGEQNTDLRS